MIEINGIPFEPLPGVKYPHKYVDIVDAIARGELDEFRTIRTLILDDLFFICYFVLGISPSNHPFVIAACNEVKEGPASNTLDVWAREHFKSTIITVAETIQVILGTPEIRNAIFSYAKTPALKLFRQIKTVLETNEFLKRHFDDVLYMDPSKEAPKWGEETGLIVKRKGVFKESTLEAHGLIEGMPTSSHFDRRIYDDIMTVDFAKSPEMISDVISQFEMSQYLGTDGGTHRTIGTYYHHNDVIDYLANKKNVDGTPAYHLRLKPGTVDGTPNGAPVMVSVERQRELQGDSKSYFPQFLCDPTPRGSQKLDSSLLLVVHPDDLPKRLTRMMVLDPAGSALRADKRTNDSWAFMVFGVEPYRDDLGLSNIYILDLRADVMGHDEAMKEIVAMYMRGGRIVKLGIEKVGQSSAEIHVLNALHAKGKYLSEERDNFVVLRPGGQNKQDRIENTILWPLNNSKIHIVSTVPKVYRERLTTEMEKFPFWRDDCLDVLAYSYRMIAEHRFPKYEEDDPDVLPDIWERAFKRKHMDTLQGWMMQ